MPKTQKTGVKRRSSSHVEVGAEREQSTPTYVISVAGNPNSCLIKIQKQKVRGLLDTGAEVSLMHRRVFDSLKVKPKLLNKKANLQSVNGEALSVDGCANVAFEIGGIKMEHTMYIVNNINRKLILGRDWLLENGVRIYYDLGCIRVKGQYVPLQEDIHISSVVRLHKKIKLAPQTGTTCKCKLRNTPYFKTSDTIEVQPIEEGFLSFEPGVMITNSVGKVLPNNEVAVMIVNNTNKTFTLKKGCVIAKVSKIDECHISAVDKEVKQVSGDNSDENEWKDVDVDPQYRDEIIKLLEKNKDLFAQKDSDLSQTDTVTMKIDTGDHSPIKLRPYKTQLNNRKVIDAAVDEMLDAKIISRSRSSWSAPVVIVDKKDGSKRFCVDFRAINKITKPNSYPLPLIDEILALLGKAKYFTSLDLKSGYWQIKMDPDDREKTAFACHKGLFEFNVMPFGLCNAPSIFQELMARVLENLDAFSIAYLDDILIYSETLEEHLKHLQAVFDRLREHKLKLKLKKCGFLKEETGYLGFIINKDGIRPDPNKVAVIKSLATPTCVKEVRSFIGMCSYYRRFVPKFSEIAEPLIALTRKYSKFKWDSKCQIAFDKLKTLLSEVPELGYPDTNKPYVLHCDASDLCIGALLTQQVSVDGKLQDKPIYYLSHKLSDTQRKWPVIEKECYAIHFALQKLDHYLHNAEFTIKTDHKPLKYMLDSPMQNRKIQMWSLALQGYNCKIEYVAGDTNVSADLLSRLPAKVLQDTDSKIEEPDVNDKAFEISALNSNRFNPKDYARCHVDLRDNLEKPVLETELDMIEEQDKDEAIAELKVGLTNDKVSPALAKRYLISDNVLYFISDADSNPTLRLYVPKQLQSLVLKQYHDSNGHMGVDKTHQTAKQRYFWPNMYKEIHQYVNKCAVCQTRNLQAIKPPVQETDIPPYAFAKVSMDISGPYPVSLSGNKYILSFVDWYSGWPECFAVPDKCADTIAQILIDDIFPRYGQVLEIVTDNGSEQVNRVVRETLAALNIHHVTTSFYHPQSNAKVERFHRTLHDVLAKKIGNDNVSGDFDSWDIYLQQTVAAIRFNVSDATGFSPFFLLYNRDVVLPLDTILKPRQKYMGEDMHRIALEQQHRSFLQVHNNLKRAKQRQAKYANKNTHEVVFKVGDPIYYRNHTRRNKLDLKWKPYYRIIEQTSPVTFIIKHQLDGSTTKVHASQIRLAHVDEWEIPTQLPGRSLRQSTLVMPPEHSDSDSAPPSDQNESVMHRVAKKYRRQRENSDNESDIPLAELAKRIRNRRESNGDDDGGSYQADSESEMVMSESEENQLSDREQQPSLSHSDVASDLASIRGDVTSDYDRMSVNQISNGRSKKCRRKQPKQIKKLLEVISGLL